MSVSRNDKIANGWNVGFEVEVILGDLGNPKFFDRVENDGPMDEATPSYCQAVAKELSLFTGEKWSAPRKDKRGTGFFVLPEYDIDPINFPYEHQVAGVELITPPLPIYQAEKIRNKIADAIFELGGEDNVEFNEHTAGLGWHVNIDQGPNKKISGALYSIGVDEVTMLKGSNRMGGKYTGLQRHSFGPRLLSEMRAPNSFINLAKSDANLAHFLNCNVGKTKSYAANFSRDHYLELRHFGTPQFCNCESLEELIEDPLTALQMGSKSKKALLNHLWETFRILDGWLSEHEKKIKIRLEEKKVRTDLQFAILEFDTEDVGTLVWDGQINLEIWGAQRHETLVGAWAQAQSNLNEAFGVLCLDIAELVLLGGEVVLQSNALSKAISTLCDRIEASGLSNRPEKNRDHWFS